MSMPRLEIAKSVICYSLMIWFGFLPQNLASSAHLIALQMHASIAGMKISTAKTEVLHLSRNSDQCVLQVNGATLKQVEKFKYLEVAFTSDGRQVEELDTRIGKASAVMRGLHYSVVMKRELSRIAKLSIFKAVFVPIFTYE